MYEIPDHIMARIAERMIDVVAGITDDEQRASVAELVPRAQFLLREDTIVEVRAITPDGVVVLAQFDGETVGVHRDDDGLYYEPPI